jgi:hypothetical protein
MTQGVAKAKVTQKPDDHEMEDLTGVTSIAKGWEAYKATTLSVKETK